MSNTCKKCNGTNNSRNKTCFKCRRVVKTKRMLKKKGGAVDTVTEVPITDIIPIPENPDIEVIPEEVDPDTTKSIQTKPNKKPKKTVANIVTDVVTNIVNDKRTKAFAPNVQRLLNKIGDEKILEADAVRVPITSIFSKIANFVSNGEYKKWLKKQNYDDLFHLFLRIRLPSGTYRLEKNEFISLKKMGKLDKKAEVKSIPLIAQKGSIIPKGGYKEHQYTLNNILQTTRFHMRSKFFPYDVKNNNCQNFIAAIFRFNFLIDDDTLNFIKQNSDSLFKKMGYFRSVANTAVKVAQAADIIKQGGNIPKASKRGKSTTKATCLIEDYCHSHRIRENEIRVTPYFLEVLSNMLAIQR